MAGGKHIYQDMCLYPCASKRSRSGGGGGGGGKHIYQDLCLYQCVCERSRKRLEKRALTSEEVVMVESEGAKARLSSVLNLFLHLCVEVQLPFGQAVQPHQKVTQPK